MAIFNPNKYNKEVFIAIIIKFLLLFISIGL